MSFPFTPTALFIDEETRPLQVDLFSMDIHRDVSPDGSLVSNNHGGLVSCKLFLDVEDNRQGFFAGWFGDASQTHTAIFEFFRLSNQAQFQSVRLINAVLVSYKITRVKDDESKSNLFITMTGSEYDIGSPIIKLDF